MIVLSRFGLAHGHFVVSGKESPTARDRDAYPPAKCVYLVTQSAIYGAPVDLRSLGIDHFQFGKNIAESQFIEI